MVLSKTRMGIVAFLGCISEKYLWSVLPSKSTIEITERPSLRLAVPLSAKHKCLLDTTHGQHLTIQ